MNCCTEWLLLEILLRRSWMSLKLRLLTWNERIVVLHIFNVFSNFFCMKLVFQHFSTFFDNILHLDSPTITSHYCIYNKETGGKHSPDWHSGILLLNSPWCGCVDSFTINLQPGANTSETLLKHCWNHAIWRRSDIQQVVSSIGYSEDKILQERKVWWEGLLPCSL